MTMVYIAGPYRDPDPAQIVENVLDAVRAAQYLLSRGFSVTCPHSMMHGWEVKPDLTDAMFLENGLEQVRRCDVLLLVGRWRESEGSLVELAEADRQGLRVYKDLFSLEASEAARTHEREV